MLTLLVVVLLIAAFYWGYKRWETLQYTKLILGLPDEPSEPSQGWKQAQKEAGLK